MDSAALSFFCAILPSGTIQLAALSIIALALLMLATLIVFQRLRRTPLERERQRRLSVNELGRLGDATITDATEDILFYCYSVRGVIYTASQDISQLHEWIPSDPAKLIGPVSLKYSSQNPANSIVICEAWSGLRMRNCSGVMTPGGASPVASQ